MNWPLCHGASSRHRSVAEMRTDSASSHVQKMGFKNRKHLDDSFEGGVFFSLSLRSARSHCSQRTIQSKSVFFASFRGLPFAHVWRRFLGNVKCHFIFTNTDIHSDSICGLHEHWLSPKIWIFHVLFLNGRNKMILSERWFGSCFFLKPLGFRCQRNRNATDSVQRDGKARAYHRPT